LTGQAEAALVIQRCFRVAVSRRIFVIFGSNGDFLFDASPVLEAEAEVIYPVGMAVV
jgi:hypothetical protein